MNMKDRQAIESDWCQIGKDMYNALDKFTKQHPELGKLARKEQSFNYKDGYGEELSIVINPSNGFLLATDDVSGDSVAMSISFSELRRLAKLIDDEVPHGKDD
ncbi:hypothetical protein HIF97_12370 [Lactobacillus plantarum]|uniref:hypothetical protein n=1 Tax=Lactiplantibacillus plantarum TaxID=1590 RepID=UPI0015EC4B61|nr:hypothetical protein [Lactiplantibacillus plantarum]MBA3081137.1 hypothetical protein [Lactiplantibacillus plantarum]